MYGNCHQMWTTLPSKFVECKAIGIFCFIQGPHLYLSGLQIVQMTPVPPSINMDYLSSQQVITQIVMCGIRSRLHSQNFNNANDEVWE